jgi:DNA-binding CsgD family transcriptional regulator
MSHFKLIRLDSKTRSRSARNGHSQENVPENPTPRELEVEDLLCQGYSQENIAAILGRSINTISAHALSLYRKRRVHTQVGLLLAYLERKGIFLFQREASSHALTECGSLEVAQ